MQTDSEEVELNSPPVDGISRVKFSPGTENLLLVSSWDNTVRLYDVQRNSQQIQFQHRAAALSCAFSDPTHAFSGSIDRTIKSMDLVQGAEYTLGEHEKPVRCVEWNKAHGILVSGGWDAALKLWDPRSNSCVGQFQQPERIYSMDCSGHRIIVGTAGRHVWIWDARRMGEPEQRRESSLKYQTRCVKAFPDGQGFALSSIEGRVAMEYFDPRPEAQQQKFAFKCHRKKVQEGVDQAFPVNDISFHPSQGTFATAGADGLINVWYAKNKKRLCQFHKYPTSISSVDFNHNGTYFAVASSYTFEELEKQHPKDSIFVRMNTSEFIPKQT